MKYLVYVLFGWCVALTCVSISSAWQDQQLAQGFQQKLNLLQDVFSLRYDNERYVYVAMYESGSETEVGLSVYQPLFLKERDLITIENNERQAYVQDHQS